MYSFAYEGLRCKRVPILALLNIPLFNFVFQLPTLLVVAIFCSLLHFNHFAAIGDYSQHVFYVQPFKYWDTGFPKMYNLPYQSLQFMKRISSRKLDMGSLWLLIKIFSAGNNIYTFKNLAVKGLNVHQGKSFILHNSWILCRHTLHICLADSGPVSP